jgi:hypothetical protein
VGITGSDAGGDAATQGSGETEDPDVAAARSLETGSATGFESSPQPARRNVKMRRAGNNGRVNRPEREMRGDVTKYSFKLRISREAACPQIQHTHELHRQTKVPAETFSIALSAGIEV